MNLSPPVLRKAALATHLTFSVAWIGAVFTYLGLGITAANTHDAQTVRSAWIAMELTGWYVIVPLALASLASGLVMAIGTPWGVFRHYWVLFSLGLTGFAAVVLLLHMPTVSSQADIAREADAARLHELGGDLAHPAIGLLVLLTVLVLNVYKPRGMTGYGRSVSRRSLSRKPASDGPTRGRGRRRDRA